MCQVRAGNFEIAHAVLTKLRRLRLSVSRLAWVYIGVLSTPLAYPVFAALTAIIFSPGCFVKSFRSILFCLALAASVAAAQSSPAAMPPAKSALPERVVDLLREANFPQDALGVMVLRASDGSTVLEHRANEPMQPASTLKTLTSIVALERLGPAYRGKTELRSAGEVKADALTGDVVLRGLGDPDFDWRALQAMLQSLRFSGVRVINGDLVLDRSYFQPTRPDSGVPPFDETPEFRYNVIPDALLLNSNLMQLEIVSDDAGLRVGMTPTLDRVIVDSDMKIVDKPCADWEDFWKLPDVKKADDGRIRVLLKGEFLDRVDLADRLFRSLWGALGGTWTGVARDGTAVADTRLLAEHQSRTLAEFNRDILKRSDNPITRMTYLTLGAQRDSAADSGGSSVQSTNARGERVVRQWLQEKKIKDAGLVLDNGSGLSRTERVKPVTLAAVLRAAKQSRWAPEFMAALPIVGVDGGMRKRLTGGTAAGVARVKTGGLRNVVSVAGYMPDINGELCVVVAILNHDDAKSAVGKPIVDALLDWVNRTDTGALRSLK
jgi:serine-type D-Ala-D-Ala carboxypeptidase/endopeptidase (penicillin-binding protein 4)